MAKGWKKTGKNEYRRIDDNLYLQIGISLNDNKKYGVSTQLPGEEFITLKTDIKTKSQAISFANKYMREHPRG